MEHASVFSDLGRQVNHAQLTSWAATMCTSLIHTCVTPPPLPPAPTTHRHQPCATDPLTQYIILCCYVVDPCPAGTNPVQLTRGMDKTVAALVKDLAGLSTEVANDKDLANVAAVSAGGNPEIGQLIADAMAKVGGGREGGGWRGVL